MAHRLEWILMVQLDWISLDEGQDLMERQFTLTHDEECAMDEFEYLNSLLVGFWEDVVVQGGKLELSPSSTTTYLLSGIWIYCRNRWVEISTTENKPEEYCLSIDNVDLAPVPEPSKLNIPPRQRITNFPENCRLDRTLTHGVRVILASKLKRDYTQLVIDGPISIQTYSGDSFQISASQQYPENIEIRSIY